MQPEPGMPFDFSYKVNDEETGNIQSHSSTSDGQVVTGKYSVKLPDGRTQTVAYTVNPTSGFVAEVSYEGVAAAALIDSDQQATPLDILPDVPHQGSAPPIGKQLSKKSFNKVIRSSNSKLSDYINSETNLIGNSKLNNERFGRDFKLKQQRQLIASEGKQLSKAGFNTVRHGSNSNGRDFSGRTNDASSSAFISKPDQNTVSFGLNVHDEPDQDSSAVRHRFNPQVPLSAFKVLQNAAESVPKQLSGHPSNPDPTFKVLRQTEQESEHDTKLINFPSFQIVEIESSEDTEGGQSLLSNQHNANNQHSFEMFDLRDAIPKQLLNINEPSIINGNPKIRI